MKPLKLVMQAFGPYPNRETVDFEELSKSAIFLIKGPTGSGKTTIFDAMSMALYGKSTVEDDKAKGGRNSLEIWRCNQADWNTETVIEFTFLAGGKIYKFIRRLVPKRTKLDPVYAVCVQNAEGDFCAIDGCTKESELSQKAEELIGFNSSQFRQVVLLPQGKFERFLVADSNEKEQILSRLFDASIWDKYAKKLYDKVDAKRQELVALKQEIDISLHSDSYDFENIDQLRQYVQGLNNNLNILEDEHRLFDVEQKKKTLDEDKKIHEKFNRLKEIESVRDALRDRAEDIVNDCKKLENAKKAENVRELINKTEDLSEDLSSRNKDIHSCEEEIPRLKQAEEESKVAYEKLKNDSPIDDYNARRGMLESRKDLYLGIDELFDKLQATSAEVDNSRIKYESYRDEFEIIKSDAATKLNEYNVAEEYSRQCRNKYYADIYGDIAEKLFDGKPCPVCGSTEHPNPAPRSEDGVTKSEVEKAEKDALKKKKSWEKAEKSRNDSETELVNCKNIYDTCVNLNNEARTRYEESTKNLIEGINTYNELIEAIAKIDDDIAKYNEQLSVLSDKHIESRDKLHSQQERFAALNDELTKVEIQYKEASGVLEKALKDNGYSNLDAAKIDMLSKEDMESIQETITSYNTRVKANEEELARQLNAMKGLSEPDANTFEDRQQEIDDEINGYTQKRTSITEEIKRLTQKDNEFSKKQEYYDNNIHRVESDMAFAKKLRGDTGIGLQRYVLGIMFNQIILEANRMLRMVHGGRYHLLRTDDKGVGNKRGLELLVHDQRRPEEKGRPVGSLSGGEKFLVSLSLSIGMSAVAQKSGLHIDALFIDEGFGTLDENSISNAMDILECVQKNSGMIGIISHVTMLENNIPKHLEVIKTEKGSYIKEW